jgi:hypothetical protein
MAFSSPEHIVGRGSAVSLQIRHIVGAGLLMFHKLTGESCKNRYGSVYGRFLSTGAMNGSPTDTAATSVGAGFIPPASKGGFATQNGFSEYSIKRQQTLPYPNDMIPEKSRRTRFKAISKELLCVYQFPG